MGSKPKTRLFALIDGKSRELFNVRDLGKKGLIITSGYPKLFENNDGQFVEFVDQHYSVHPTKNGQDTSITQKTAVSDQGIKKISNVAYIHNTSEHLLWPVYARRLPIMDGATRSLHVRKKDTARRIGKFNWSKANLLYSVFVSLPNIELPDHMDDQSRRFVKNFDLYKLIIFVTYLNRPSMNEGDVTGLSTSSEVYDGLKTENHIQIHQESCSVDHMVEIHRQLMDSLRSKMDLRLKSLFGAGTKGLIFASQNFARFTKAPIIKHK